MKNVLTEFLGTFFLVLTIGLVVVSATPLAGLAIGAVLMVMVYMGGHISGGHYNPAVTLALVLRGSTRRAEMVPYWVAQIVGGLAASLVVWMVTGRTFAPAPSPTTSALQALWVEFLFTFALALVVLHAATSPKTTGNSWYGLAIGFTLGVGAMAGGPYSGGAFNPAVGIGPILVDALGGGGEWGNLWIYLVGPLAGGMLASVVYAAQHGADS